VDGEGFSSGIKWKEREAVHYLHLVLRLSMNGVLLKFLPYAHTETGCILPLPYEITEPITGINMSHAF
jgi:hypothetical protein